MLRPLEPGDRIALVAPSSPFETEKLSRACRILESKGYVASPGKHSLSRRGYLAGEEAERAEDLISAICDPEVAAIICIRGGYGSGRLLPWLPFSIFQDNAKIFLGHSDITFLHLAFRSRTNWVTFHGPNLLDMVELPERLESALEALSGGRSDFSWDLHDSQVLRPGAATGRLIGGNLTCLAHLMGTPYFPDLTGALLMVEDCGEAVYRLDRLFTQLKLAGILQGLAGLILGHFKNCGDSQQIWDMVMEQVKTYHFPVVANLPFGHGPVNQVIPFGVPFVLNTHEHIFRALQHPFR